MHPQGQGRLAIIFFSNRANYSSVYSDSNGQFKTKSFDYPQVENGPSLFDINRDEDAVANSTETGTKLQLHISKPQTLGRANTFFKKHDDIDKLKSWFIETFFPFFMEIEDLCLDITLNENNKIIYSIIIPSRLKEIRPKKTENPDYEFEKINIINDLMSEKIKGLACDIAKQLIKAGVDINLITKITKLTSQEINSLDI